MITNILAPLDGLTTSETGLAWAELAASRCRASVRLLSVLDQPDLNANGHKEKAEDYLRAQRDALRARGLDAEYEVAGGPAAEAILERAAAADISVMTYGTSRWLFGGVLDRVLQGITQPLVVVRAMPARTGTLPAPEKVLVALDSTDYSQGILLAANNVAASLGASIVLCHVVPPLGHFRAAATAPPGMARAIEQMLDEGRDFVAKAAAGLAGNGTAVETAVVMGEAAPEIVRLASRAQAGLIAMATRGGDSLSSVMSSVARAVVQSSHVPCLLSRAQPTG